MFPQNNLENIDEHDYPLRHRRRLTSEDTSPVRTRMLGSSDPTDVWVNDDARNNFDDPLESNPLTQNLTLDEIINVNKTRSSAVRTTARRRLPKKPLLPRTRDQHVTPAPQCKKGNAAVKGSGGGSEPSSSSGSNRGTHWSSMGAAPRRREAFIENRLVNSFTKMVEGRGLFCTESPQGTANWNVAKWKEHLDFLPFSPRSEVELEHWFEDAAYKITANSATAEITLKVIQLVSEAPLRSILNSCLLFAEQMVYIEDLADCIAVRLFKGLHEMQELEQGLFQQNRKHSVLEAFMTYRRLEECYSYMAARRHRGNILGTHQVITVIQSLLPIKLVRKIMTNLPTKVWTPSELFTYALELEDQYKSVPNDITYAEEEIYQSGNPLLEEEDPMEGKSSICSGCLGGHLRKHCPHLKSRCRLCGKIGHISRACKNKTITDSAGVRRLVAQPKQSGVVVETTVDNTTPAQLKTVAGVVDKLIGAREKDKARAKAKYAQEKQRSGKTVRSPPQRSVLLIEDQEVEDLEQSEDEVKKILPTYPVYNYESDLDIIPRKRAKLLEVRVLINAKSVHVYLDTGATINCMSTITAAALGIFIEERAQYINIRNIHNQIFPAPLSELVEVTMPGSLHVVECRFALIERATKTILALPTMTDLDISIHLANRTISARGEVYEILAIEEESTTTPVTSSTLNPSQFTSVEEEVQSESLKWEIELSHSEKRSVQELLKEYQDIWYHPKAGQCTTVTLSIVVDGRPKRVAVRPTPYHMREELNRQIDDLLAVGVIRPAPDCLWVSPCSLVPKPRSNKWRLVIDYRYINTLVQDDSYQIPNISDLIMRLAGHKIFSLIDLNWGFWNVSIDEGSRKYTGFVVPDRGVFEWTVMPFGFKIGPPVFQRAIEKALRHLLNKGGISVYIDDIIIFTTDVETHILLMKEVMEALRVGGFYINLAKAILFRHELLYLGHYISEHQLKPDPAKIDAIQKAVAPKDKRSLLSFCAAANYLRAYIPRFSELIAPLTNLTAKNKRFVWGVLEQASFEDVKSQILNACYLQMPRWNAPFIIFTDASDVALGAALAQVSVDETSLDFIAFSSKKLSETQRNWSPTERELFAIVWACETFQQYIKGSRPLIYSDHKSLTHLTNAESPKMKRWAIRLSEFNPMVTHIGGSDNNVADWLSRSVPDDDDANIPEHMYVPEVLHLVHSGEKLFELPKPIEMSEEAKLEEATMKPGTLDWYDGVAYGRQSRRIYIPMKFRNQLLLWFHASRYGGHQGVTRTTNRLRKFVWWPNLQLNVVDFINGCPVCNATKPLKGTGGETGALNRPNLFELVSVDFIGPRRFHTRSYYIMVIVDHYSRYMVAVTLAKIATPAPEITFRDHWIAKFGSPKTVLADRDPVLTSPQFKDFIMNECGSKLYFTSTEYPQGNGINESSHRILETAIRTHFYGLQGSVENMVADAAVIYNCTPNRIIGDTPASVVFGCDLHIPGLEDYEPDKTEESRLTRIRNFRGYRLLSNQLKELDEFRPLTPSRADKTHWKVGDIVTYRLSKAEHGHAIHYSNEMKHFAIRSFPHRVIKVTKKDLILKPIWTRGGERQAPQEECKLITTFIPELMREEAQQLYPHLPWNTGDSAQVPEETGTAGVRGSGKPIRTGVEEKEKLPKSPRKRRRAREEEE